MQTPNLPAIRTLRPAWNKGRIVGQKRPLKPKHVWAIRVWLERAENHRDLALFNMETTCSQSIAISARASNVKEPDILLTTYIGNATGTTTSDIIIHLGSSHLLYHDMYVNRLNPSSGTYTGYSLICFYLLTLQSISHYGGICLSFV